MRRISHDFTVNNQLRWKRIGCQTRKQTIVNTFWEVELVQFGWSFFFQSESCAQKLGIAIVQFTLNEYESGSTAFYFSSVCSVATVEIGRKLMRMSEEERVRIEKEQCWKQTKSIYSLSPCLSSALWAITHTLTPANHCSRGIHISLSVYAWPKRCVFHTRNERVRNKVRTKNIRKIRFLYFKSIDIFYKWSQFLLTTTRSSGLCMSRETNDMTNQTKPKQKLQPIRFFFCCSKHRSSVTVIGFLSVSRCCCCCFLLCIWEKKNKKIGTQWQKKKVVRLAVLGFTRQRKSHQQNMFDVKQSNEKRTNARWRRRKREGKNSTRRNGKSA